VSDEDDVDPSDWLSGQFDPTKPLPKQKPAVPPAVAPEPPVAAPPAASPGGFNWGLRPGGDEAASPPPANPPVVTPPAASPPVATPPAASLPVATPPTVPPAVLPPASPPPAVSPPTLIEPPLPRDAPPPAVSPADVPTQAMTQPMSWQDVAAVQRPAASAQPPKSADPEGYVGQATEAYVVQPWDPFEDAKLPAHAAPAAPVSATPADDLPSADSFAGSDDPTSALDSLFGENQFHEYEEIGVRQAIAPLVGAPPPQTDADPAVRAPFSQTQKILVWVAAALVAVLALIALFLLGQRLGAATAAPSPVTVPTGAASSTPVPAATGVPAAVGTQAWTALNGGECIKPFTSAWAATFTVVDCGGSHAAQMLFKGTLPDAAGSAYPTGSQFKTEITPLCSAATVINYNAAKAVNDLQVSFSYPAASNLWDANDRTYYCFVNRKSGGDLPGDLSVK
jgi:hypothetical protein